MFRAQIGGQRRSQIAGELLKYVTSPQFKNPIEELVQRAADLQGMLHEEMKTHARTWHRRWGHYRTIQWNTEHVQANLRLVLEGKPPRPVIQPKTAALQLPAPRT